MKVSGGERQRVDIARTFHSDALVLVMDRLHCPLIPRPSHGSLRQPSG